MLSFGDIWYLLRQTVEQTVEVSVIWDAMVLMWRHCSGENDNNSSNKWLVQFASGLCSS